MYTASIMGMIKSMRRFAALGARRSRLILASVERLAVRQGLVAAMGSREGGDWPPIDFQPHDIQE